MDILQTLGSIAVIFLENSYLGWINSLYALLLPMVVALFLSKKENRFLVLVLPFFLSFFIIDWEKFSSLSKRWKVLIITSVMVWVVSFTLFIVMINVAGIGPRP